MYDNLILIVNSFHSVLIILTSLIFQLQWHACELAGEVCFSN